MTKSDQIHTTVYHVGAAGGMHRAWIDYPGVVNYVCFDAEESAAAELKAAAEKGADKNTRMFVEARPVFSHNGPIDFHVYDIPTLSSTFLFDEKITHRFRYSDVRHLKTTTLDCTTIDEIAKSRGEAPDSLTIDAQGASLAILEGATNVLARCVLSVRVEVEFLSVYRGQPLFDRVLAFMFGNGFRLIRIEKCGSGEAGVSTDSGPFSESVADGVPAWADAIFLKTPPLPKWAAQAPQESGALLFRSVLFALNNRIGSVGLDLIFELAEMNYLAPIVNALAASDREMLHGKLLAHLEVCEKSVWETDATRRTHHQKQQQKFREILRRNFGPQ